MTQARCPICQMPVLAIDRSVTDADAAYHLGCYPQPRRRPQTNSDLDKTNKHMHRRAWQHQRGKQHWAAAKARNAAKREYQLACRLVANRVLS